MSYKLFVVLSSDLCTHVKSEAWECALGILLMGGRVDGGGMGEGRLLSLPASPFSGIDELQVQ